MACKNEVNPKSKGQWKTLEVNVWGNMIIKNHNSFKNEETSLIIKNMTESILDTGNYSKTQNLCL